MGGLVEWQGSDTLITEKAQDDVTYVNAFVSSSMDYGNISAARSHWDADISPVEHTKHTVSCLYEYT